MQVREQGIFEKKIIMVRKKQKHRLKIGQLRKSLK